ncbi:MAG: STAS domain-containing protein, partial [Prochlorothrix sp.]
FLANVLTIDRLSALQSQAVRSAGAEAISGCDAEVLLAEPERALLQQGAGRVLLLHLSGPMIFGVAKAIAREHSAIDNYDVLLVDLSEVPKIGVTSSLAIENAIKEALDAGRAVIVVGATGRVRTRLEKLGIAGLIPEEHWMEDRLNALQTGLSIIRQKQGFTYDGVPTSLSAT